MKIMIIKGTEEALEDDGNIYGLDDNDSFIAVYLSKNSLHCIY